MKAQELQQRMPRTALAFRGYNVTNLGRSGELMAHATYGPVVRDSLRNASVLCSEVIGKAVDLEARVREDHPLRAIRAISVLRRV